MKKYCLLAACLCALLMLCGCTKKDEQPSDEPLPIVTDAPTQAPVYTPEPVVTPEPKPTVALSQYVYATVSNTNLEVTFQYPSHWINDPGKSTICYLEPVNGDEVGCRVAVAAKTVSRAPDTTSLKKQLASFAEALEQSYFSFTLGEAINTDEAVFGTKGLSQSYTARDEQGNRISGFILMAYVSSNKHIYVLNFSAPSGRFEEMSVVLTTVRQSLAVV